MGAECLWAVLTADSRCRDGRWHVLQEWQIWENSGLAQQKLLQSHFSGSQEPPSSNFQEFLPCALSNLLFSGSLRGLCGTSAGHLGEVLAVCWGAAANSLQLRLQELCLKACYSLESTKSALRVSLVYEEAEIKII